MKPTISFVEMAKEWVRTGEIPQRQRHLPKRFHQREVELTGNSRVNSTFQWPLTDGVPARWLV
jgi:hypothetical protein